MKLKRLSPLRYPGGKAKILDFVIRLIEDNNLSGSHYVEPYAGGAGVALGLLFGGYVSDIHINDNDPAIYAFWNSIVNETELFIKQIKKIDITVKEWKKQRYVYNNLNDFSELERGFAAFYLNRCNRSGIIKGGCIGGQEQAGDYRIDARFNKVNLIKRIENISEFKDKIHLYNMDTLQLLKKNKKQFKKAILYLDPPYYVKGYQLYKNHYVHDDHVQIAKFMKKIKGFWMVSYDNVPEIMDIYSDSSKKEFNIQYSAGSKRVGKEVMFFSNKILVPEINIC